MINPRASIIQTANALNVSDRTVNSMRDTIWKIYDEVQPFSPILTPRQMPKKRKKGDNLAGIWYNSHIRVICQEGIAMSWIIGDNSLICDFCGHEIKMDKTKSGAMIMPAKCVNCCEPISYETNSVLHVRTGIEFLPTKIIGIK